MHSRDAVVDGEAFVEVGEVGVDHGARRQVTVQHLGEKKLGLQERGLGERVVEVVVVVEGGGGRGVLHFSEVDPVIEKRFLETVCLRVGEQALRLDAQHAGLTEFSLGGQGAQRVVRRRVPEKKREARGEGVGVEAAGLLVEEHEARRRQHGGVAGEHRFGEAQASRASLMDQGEESLHVGVGDWATIGALNKGAHEPRGVLGGIFRNDIDGDVAEGGNTATGVAAFLVVFLAVDHGQRNAGSAARDLDQREVAEEESVTCGRVLVGERPCDLHPTKRHAGRAVGGHQRVHKTGSRIGPRAVEPRGVGHERLVGVEPDLAEVVDGGLGREIE